MLTFGAAIFLTGLSYLIGLGTGWVTEVSWLEVAAVGTSYWCTLLCVVQTRWNYPIGIVTTALYSILFWQYELIALSIFNLYLTGSLIYGWFRWGPDENSRPVTDLPLSSWATLGYLGAGILIALGYLLVYRYFSAPVLWVDVGVASLSGVAQLLLDNKRRQTWIIWGVVNIFSIWLFWQSALYLVMLQYLFFLGNTVFGWIMWSKNMKGKQWQTA